MSNKEKGPKVVVVGTGVGCRVHVPALRGAGFDVVALVDVDAGLTAERAKANDIPHSFTDVDEAITKTGASVVTIATPPSTHFPLVMAVLARGCHVICEKPFALDYTEAHKMLDAAEKAGVVHRLGHEFRFAPQSTLVKNLIRDGAIGKPRFATAVLYNGYAAGFGQPPAWWFKQETGGGWLNAHGSHLIDQIRSEFGEFTEVGATLLNLSPKVTEVDDSYIVRYRLTNGIEGVLQSTSGVIGQPGEMYRIAGSKGTIWTDRGAVWLSDQDGTREVPIPDSLSLKPFVLQSDDPRFKTMEWEILAPIEVPPYIKLCESFRAAIEGREPKGSSSAATFADGAAHMKVIDAIRESASNNGATVSITADRNQ